MQNLNIYDTAVNMQHRKLNILALPIICWDFNYEFKSELLNSLRDFKKLKTIAIENRWRESDLDFEKNLKESVVIITNAKQTIVFASHKLKQMNGFSENEVLGKSPKMFHGLETCQKTSNEIHNAIQQKLPFEKTVLNYKKNGKIYHCHIKCFPIFNKKGELANFIAFEKAA